MQRRALLVGCPLGALRGTERDVHAVAEYLAAHGFATDVRCGAAATRDAILAGYRALIDGSAAGDAALFYYSGHGGLAVPPAPAPGEPAAYQFIVPVDIDQSTDADFFGITSLELSALQAELTARTANVTVILDCCHAARMSRGGPDGLVVKALDASWQVGVAAHVERLRAAGRLAPSQLVEGNPLAVRLVAAAREQSAFEYQSPDGQPTGLFTESLLAVLRAADGLPMTWTAIAAQTAERVLAVTGDQRPDGEGPLRRRPFSLEEADPDGAAIYALVEGRPALRGGRLFGMSEGDEFAVSLQQPGPGPGPGPEPAPSRALLKVLSVTSSWARVAVEPPAAAAAIPPGACAVPLRGVGRLDQIRALADGTGAAALPAGWELTWGLVDGAAAGPALPEAAAALHVGDRFWIRLDNRASRPLYLSVYDLGVSGRISLLTASEGSGIRVEPGAATVVGDLPGQGLVGVPLGWPPSLPPDAARGETLVAVITDEPIDLRGWEQEAEPDRGQREPAQARYAVRRLDFQLDPRPRPDHG